MELHISYCICAQISLASYLRKNKSRYRANIEEIMQKGVTIHGAEARKDHIHMLVSIPSSLSV